MFLPLVIQEIILEFLINYSEYPPRKKSPQYTIDYVSGPAGNEDRKYSELKKEMLSYPNTDENMCPYEFFFTLPSFLRYKLTPFTRSFLENYLIVESDFYYYTLRYDCSKSVMEWFLNKFPRELPEFAENVYNVLDRPAFKAEIEKKLGFTFMQETVIFTPFTLNLVKSEKTKHLVNIRKMFNTREELYFKAKIIIKHFDGEGLDEIENRHVVYEVVSSYGNEKLLKKYEEYLVWENVSMNPNAMDLIKNNRDKISPYGISWNKEAVNFLKENLQFVDWSIIMHNKNAFEIIKNNLDKLVFCYFNLSYSPHIYKLSKYINFNEISFTETYYDSKFDRISTIHFQKHIQDINKIRNIYFKLFKQIFLP